MYAIHLSPFLQFSKDYAYFVDRVADFDQRLGSILCQAFHDCSGCESVFKVHIHTLARLSYHINLRFSQCSVQDLIFIF